MHAINTYMKKIGYTSNRKDRSFDPLVPLDIKGYAEDPSLLYLPINDERKIKEIIGWAKVHYKNSFKDTIHCDNGIILIGKTKTFAEKFISLYKDHYKNNTK